MVLKHPEYAHGISDAELIKEAIEFCDAELDGFEGMDYDSDSEVCCQRSNTFIRELVLRLTAALSSRPAQEAVAAETTYAKLTIENAYGMLWLTVTDDKRIHEARKRLLTLLDKDGQRRGIEVARKMFGQTTEAEIMRADVLPDEKAAAPVENRPEWIWYCESTSGVPVVTFGRWAKHPQQARYKLADIQPTEHDHSTQEVTDAEVPITVKLHRLARQPHAHRFWEITEVANEALAALYTSPQPATPSHGADTSATEPAPSVNLRGGE